ncbi:MAG: hypothetical protein AABW67_00340 [Nanoarchaeota archaeon]
MSKKCAICEIEIIEESSKLKGTIIKVRNEKGKNQEVYVCSECMKIPNYIEVAVIRDA